MVVGAMAAYWGPLGGPFSRFLLPILNGPLAPFRSVYKLEPAIGLLVALGVAHSLQKLFQWKPPRVTRGIIWRGVATVAIVAVLASLATPYLLGRVTYKQSFPAIPSYWYRVADFLARESPRSTALVLPAMTHGDYLWGWTVDQPLEALASSPWTVDLDVPHGGAGSTRMLDAIELALRTGTPSPGLSALLQRSGIKYVVLQNDLQWQLSDSPSPFEVHQVLEASGLTRVAKFGPTIETSIGDYPTLSLNDTGPHVPYPAVEIFQATTRSRNNSAGSPIATYPVSTAALVSGGPEAIKQLLDSGVLGDNQAAILAGDWLGSYHGPLFAVTDTLRRENVDFGLVNDNTSYPYTATGQTPDETGVPDEPAAPSQLLPFPGVQHQTVAVLKGAKSITASSAGSAIFDLPEYNPANVFDGESSTGWITGSSFGSIGEWIQISFDHPVNPKGTQIQFIEGLGHPVVTGVRVSTNRGSVLTRVGPTNSRQRLNVPAGTADYLRVTFASLKGGVSDPAGIRAISIPGVHVQQLLKPPQESAETGAQRLVFSFQTAPYDSVDLFRGNPEPVLARQFSTPRRMSMSVAGKASPRPSPALDALIAVGSSKLTITASSSLGNLPEFRPQNLIDGSPNTVWIASSPKASIHMQWPTARTLSSLTVVDAQTAFVASPKEILISSPAGNRLLHVGSCCSALLNFAPLETKSVTVSFPKIQTRVTRNGLNETVQAPVGLAELVFPALAAYQIVPPNPADRITVPCGYGPPIVLDGTTYETSLDPTIGNLLALNPVDFRICRPSQPLTLSGGSHSLVTQPSGMPFNVSALTISEVGTPEPPQSVTRHAQVLSWGQESGSVAVGAGPATYLEVHQDYDVGWRATLNGKTLTPIVLDGWQQGFVVPAGRGGTVQITFAPERTYLLGLAVGAVGVILLVLIAFGVLGKRRGVGLDSSPPWMGRVPLWLSVGLTACVVLVVGGPLVLLVPVLVLLGSRRPTWLPWVAFVAMTTAGIIAAINPGTGALTHQGAFSAVAQVCGVLALSAVLVPVAYWRSKRRERRDFVAEPADAPFVVIGTAGDAFKDEPAHTGSGD